MPSHSHDPSTVCRSFHLPRTVMARVQALADSMRLPVAEVIRRAITAYLARFESEHGEGKAVHPISTIALPGEIRRVANKREDP